jgi:hypothetical protein
MFDLEKAISDWRQQTVAAGLKSPQILRELESHLREDIEEQTRAGLDRQQAFVHAIVRLGHATSLEKEFAKTVATTRTSDRLRLVFCVLLVSLILCLCGFTFSTLGMNAGEWLVASSAVASSLFIAGFWTRAVRFFPVIQNKRKRYAIEVVIFFSGFLCSNLFCTFVLPYFERNLNDKILPAIWLWAIFPIALFLAAACGIEQAVRNQSSASQRATF